MPDDFEVADRGISDKWCRAVSSRESLLLE